MAVTSKRVNDPEINLVKGERVILRTFRWSDVVRYIIWAQEKEVQRYFAPILSSEDPRWLINLWKQPATDIMAILAPVGRKGRWTHIGGIGFQHIDRVKLEAEFGFAIGREAWRNQGYGTDALKALIRYAFGPRDLKRVYARVLATNRRSLRVLDKTGFTQGDVVGQVKVPGNGEVDLVYLKLEREAWEAKGELG